MFFTPVITLLASPLPQHDDGRTDLTFLLQLHLSPVTLSTLLPREPHWGFSLPNFRSRQLVTIPLQRQIRRHPFIRSKPPSIPAFNLDRNLFLAILLVARVHEFSPCSGCADSDPVRDGWLFFRPSKRLRPSRRADTCRLCAPQFNSRSLLVWES